MSRSRRRKPRPSPVDAPRLVSLDDADVQAMATAVAAAWAAIYPVAISICLAQRRPEVVGVPFTPELHADLLCSAFGSVATHLGPEVRASAIDVMHRAILAQLQGGDGVRGVAGEGGGVSAERPGAPVGRGPHPDEPSETVVGSGAGEA